MERFFHEFDWENDGLCDAKCKVIHNFAMVWRVLAIVLRNRANYLEAKQRGLVAGIKEAVNRDFESFWCMCVNHSGRFGAKVVYTMFSDYPRLPTTLNFDTLHRYLRHYDFDGLLRNDLLFEINEMNFVFFRKIYTPTEKDSRVKLRFIRQFGIQIRGKIDVPRLEESTLYKVRETLGFQRCWTDTIQTVEDLPLPKILRDAVYYSIYKRLCVNNDMVIHRREDLWSFIL